MDKPCGYFMMDKEARQLLQGRNEKGQRIHLSASIKEVRGVVSFALNGPFPPLSGPQGLH